jgi:hypothetical protein
MAGMVYAGAEAKTTKVTSSPPGSTNEGSAGATTKPAGDKLKGSIDVYFSPGYGCIKAIVEEIQAARKIIRIQVGPFASQAVTEALLDARKRGVKVTAVLDKSNRTSKSSAAGLLKDQGAKVVIDDKHAMVHNKIILIDGKVVITGSFDFSRDAAESKAGNLLVIHGFPSVYARYASNFARHYRHSVPYEGIAEEGGGPVPDTPAEKHRTAETADVGVKTSPRALPDEDVTVYVTKTGKKYHKEGCQHLRRGRIPSKLNTAKTSGYTPCSRCKPPK